MPKAATHVPAAPVSLVQVLSDLGLDTRRAPKKSFADRLAELIDLSGAIDLSEFLRGLGRIPASGVPEAGESDRPRAVFQAQHADMLEAISRSFRPAATGESANPGGFSLPAPKPGTLTADADADAWAPYLRFYALQQSEMERRIGTLRRALRQHLATTSPALAQLAVLDNTLDATLIDYSRRSLAVLPRLLGKRFSELARAQREADSGAGTVSESQDWLEEGGWLWQFHQDMQRVLLAELGLRLQPLQGMLDALDCVDKEL